jgi:hypothetical protein
VKEGLNFFSAEKVTENTFKRMGCEERSALLKIQNKFGLFSVSMFVGGKLYLLSP